MICSYPRNRLLSGLNLVRPTPHMDFVPGFQTSGRAPRDSSLAGRSIVGGLWKAVLEKGIPYHLSTRATRLYARDGGITGVQVHRADGTTETVVAAEEFSSTPVGLTGISSSLSDTCPGRNPPLRLRRRTPAMGT